jgi:hypothetical protein
MSGTGHGVVRDERRLMMVMSVAPSCPEMAPFQGERLWIMVHGLWLLRDLRFGRSGSLEL